MKKIVKTVGAAGLLAVCAVCGLALVALLAVPFAASAGQQVSNRWFGDSRTVATCQERAGGEHPRAQLFLDELVTDQVISPEQAAEIESRLGDKHFQGCVGAILWERGNALQATAGVTATEPRAVLGAVIAGQSLSQYASEHGVDDATLIAAIMEVPNARAAELVAGGELDQATADSILAGIESRVTAQIQRTDIGARRFAG